MLLLLTINISLFTTVLISCQESTNSLPNSNFLNVLPDTLLAGNKMYLELKNLNTALVVQNSYETMMYQGLSSDTLFFNIAGKYYFQYLYNKQIVATKNITILPQIPKTADLLVGKKAIVANGKETAMAVLIPEDAFGNINLTDVQFSFLRPNQQTEEKQGVPTLLAICETFNSQIQTGKTLISAKIGQVTTSVREVSEVAGMPRSFGVSAIEIVKYADNRQYFQARTDILQDTFGNIVENGTMVELLVQDDNEKKRKLTAYTLHGIAVWKVRNPAVAGELSLHAQVGRAKSNHLKIVFFPTNATNVALLKP